MAIVSIGTLLQVRYDNGDRWVDEHLFQNCNAIQREGDDLSDGIVTEGGKNYSFLNFVYQGATRTRNGDNLEAALGIWQQQDQLWLCPEDSRRSCSHQQWRHHDPAVPSCSQHLPDGT